MVDERLSFRKKLLELILASPQFTGNILPEQKRILCDYILTDKTIRAIAKNNNVMEHTVKVSSLTTFRKLVDAIEAFNDKKKNNQASQFEKFSNLTLYHKHLQELKDKDIEDFPEALEIPVAYLNIDVRPLNALLDNGITTLGKLLLCTKRDLLRYRNFGNKGLRSVLDMLQVYNLTLRD